MEIHGHAAYRPQQATVRNVLHKREEPVNTLASQTALKHTVLTELKTQPYLPQKTFGQFLLECRKAHPALHACLDLWRLSRADWARLFDLLGDMPAHFESRNKGGRGEAYREAQNRNPLIRARGIKALFDLLKSDGEPLHSRELVLDAMGGNGTLTRAMRQISPFTTPFIITSDASPMMIADGLAQGLPAIRQPVQVLLFGDSTLDGVILAYGTHHIPPQDRLAAFKELHRVVKPGHRVVIQDFEEGSPTARWYSELLHEYTMTRHDCRHFTREGLKELCLEAGFTDVRILEVYDPFVVQGDSPEEAQRALVDHVCSLFALEKLYVPGREEKSERWKEAQEVIRPYGTFRPEDLPRSCGAIPEPAVTRLNGRYVAEFPRVALVAVAARNA
jgi:SAM-dependent methyltransferase